MTAPEQGFNIKAAAWTVGVHILLLIFFLLFKYSTPVIPPVEELGMEVNLGTSEDGSGTDQPMSTDAPAPEAAVNAYKTAAPQTNEARAMMESDDPDAPAIAPANSANNTVRHETRTNTNTRTPNTQRQNNANSTQQQRPRYVYSGGTGAGGNSAASNAPGTSEGNTTGNGDRGVPGGTPGASNYTGSPGPGTGGIGHNLSGRDVSPRQFTAEFKEGGRVVIRVKVDREGNIISKSIKSSPNKALSNIALQKLGQAKFSRSPDAAPEQFGEITIVFKTRS